MEVSGFFYCSRCARVRARHKGQVCEECHQKDLKYIRDKPTHQPPEVVEIAPARKDPPKEGKDKDDGYPLKRRGTPPIHRKAILEDMGPWQENAIRNWEDDGGTCDTKE